MKILFRLGLFCQSIGQARDDSLDFWEFPEQITLASGIIFFSFQKIMIGMKKKPCQVLHCLVLLASMKLFESK